MNEDLELTAGFIFGVQVAAYAHGIPEAEAVPHERLVGVLREVESGQHAMLDGPAGEGRKHFVGLARRILPVLVDGK